MAEQTYRIKLEVDIRNLKSGLRHAQQHISRLNTNLTRQAQELKKNAAAANENARAQKAAGEAANKVAAATQNTGKAVKAASDDTSRLNKSLSATKQHLTALAGISGILAFKKLSQSAIEFDQSLRNVNSLINTEGTTLAQSEASYRRWGAEIIGLTQRLPQSANELAKGFYQIASSGFSGADGLKVLDAAAQAASAGLSTTENAANAITAVLNAYALGADSAQRVSDALFQTVNLGVIEFDELSQGLGDVIGIAGTTGVQIEELGAAIATLTRTGANSSETMTRLKALMTVILKPGEELAAVFKEIGYSSGAAGLQSRGLYGVMQDIQKYTGGATEDIVRLFGNVRSSAGAIALLTDEGELFTEMMKQGGTEAATFGATAHVLEEQSKSVDFQLKILANTLDAKVKASFQKVAPEIAQALKMTSDFIKTAQVNNEVLKPFVDKIKELAAAFRDFVEVIANVAARGYRSFEPLIKALGAVTGVGFRNGLTVLKTALQALTFIAEKTSAVLSPLAVLLIGRYVLSALAGSRATIAMRTQLQTLAASATAARASMLALNKDAVMSGLKNAGKQGAIGIAIWGVSQLIGKYMEAREEHKKTIKEFAKTPQSDFNLSDPLQLENAVYRTRTKYAELEKLTNEWGETSQRLITEQHERDRAAAESGEANYSSPLSSGAAPFRNQLAKEYFKDYGGSMKEATARLNELRKEQNKLIDSAANLKVNTEHVSQATGYSTNQVKEYASRIGIDLTRAYDISDEARIQAIDGIRDEQKQLGLVGDAAQSLSDAQKTLLVENAEAFQEYVSTVRDGYATAADVVKKFGGDVDVTFAKIKQHYEDQRRAVNDFAINIRKAIAYGLDPQLIDRFLREGPQQAGQTLAAIVSGSDKTVRSQVDLINKAEAEQKRALTLLEQMAQQMFIINNSSNDALVANAKTKLSELVTNFGKAGTDAGTELKKGLDQGTEAVNQSVDGYGARLKLAASSVLAAFGINVGLIKNIGSNLFGTFVGKKKADGGIENHVAEIAQGQTPYRIWAEPETGGEAYIPLSQQKRARSTQILNTVATRFGYSLMPAQQFATGGVVPPPHWPSGTLTNPANAALDFMYRTFSATKATATDSLVGSGYQSITNYLNNAGVPFVVTSTTGGQHAKGSYHYVGKAVDLVGPNMLAIFNALAKARGSLAELFYTPAGYSIKNSQSVPPIAAAQHYSHVHAATYDNGGILRPGLTMAYNHTGRNETVLTASDMEQIYKLLSNNRSTFVINEAHSPRETAREVDRILK